MKKKFKFGVVGAGFMSSAIINGALKSNVIDSDSVIVSDVNQNALDNIAKKGVSITTNNKEVVNNSEFVLFAVKPQSLSDVLETIKGCDCNKFISIMAGVKKEKIKSVFNNAMVARCMPNTPCSIGEGAIGLDVSDYTLDSDVEFISKLLGSLAKVVIVKEDKLNAVTGVSGSSPAYFYMFLKSIIDAGVKNGLTEDQAKELATNTMIGAGKMVLSNPDKTIDELINAVCSKGGTTIEAVKTFESNNLNEITERAIEACIKRSIELENL